MANRVGSWSICESCVEAHNEMVEPLESLHLMINFAGSNLPLQQRMEQENDDGEQYMNVMMVRNMKVMILSSMKVMMVSNMKVMMVSNMKVMMVSNMKVMTVSNI